MTKDKKMKKIVIPASDKTKLAKGHQPHRTGAGTHDNRPKRQRTRNAVKRQWEKEQ